MERTSFLYYLDWARMLLEVPPELRLKIDDAIKHYVLEGTEPTEAVVKYSMFALIKAQIDRDNERYQARCDKNRDNINKRWEDVRTNTNEYERKQSNTNNTDTDTDTDKDKDTDILNKESIEKATTSVATPTPKKRFTPPSVQDVDVFAHEFAANNGLQVPPTFSEGFVDYYTANGWKAGRNPMRDWRAACRRWLRDNTNNNSHGNTFNRPSKAQLNADAVREVEKQIASILD